MDLPTGTVTFLLTDIEGSTGLWERQPELMQDAISRHDLLLRLAVEQHGGSVVKTTGDGLHAVFVSAPDAVKAALAGQRALKVETWDPAVGSLLVRMAIYTGTAEQRDGDYYGPAINRVSRLLSAGYGGQTLISQGTQELIRDDLPEQVALVDLGEHRLRDVARPEHLYQLTAIDLPADFPPLKSLEAHRTNLPSQPTPFIGREDELISVAQLLRREGVRLVNLTGPGGIGKTRLSLQVANDLLPEFDNGVFFVALAATAEPEHVISAIAEALALHEMGGQMLLEILKQHLSNKATLLVLDNFEHLLEAADMLAELLEGAPGLKVLVTSREALNLHEEWLFPVGGMSFPLSVPKVEKEWPSLETYGAVQLFVESARRVRPDFSLKEEKENVVRICWLVEGMPLAIELAASWTRTLDTKTIAGEIEKGIDFLTSRLRNVPERHRSVRAVFDYSWQQLSHEEQIVFGRLSIFRGGFRRSAVERVAGASLPVLTGLVDKSLLNWEPGPDQAPTQGRYQIHELLRQYAREKLDTSPGMADRILDLHSKYYTEFLYQHKQDFEGAGQRRAVREISADLDNIRSAWRRAVESDDLTSVGKVANPYSMYFNFQGRFQECVEAFEKAIERLNRGQPDTQRELVLATLLVHLGYNYIRLGQFERTRGVFEHSRAIFEDLETSPPPGFSTDPLCGLALLALTIGDYAGAVALGDEARRQCEDRDDDNNLQIALYVLTDASFALGRYENAKAYAQQAFRLTQETHNRWMSAYILNLMGNVCRALGDFEEARGYYQSSYAMKQEFNDPEGMAAALNRLARTAWVQGDYQGSENLYHRGLALYQDIYDPGGKAMSLHGLGDTAQATGHFQSARNYYHQALDIAVEIKWPPVTLSILASIGDLLRLSGDPERGVELLSLVILHPAADRETKDRAENTLALAANELPIEQYKIAKKKGESGDLEFVSAALLQELAHHLESDLGPSYESQIKTNISSTIDDQPLADPLTPRELEVLQLIANGLTNQEIADSLFIAIGTVKSYTSQIYSKLGVNNRTQAIARARELGLIG
jgi:predicted ATPase/class 3 adenylate cyclase/DNA-binding CsgD family transcriptional regulator